MATDYGIRVMIDSTVSDPDKLKILELVLAAVKFKTVVVEHNAAYAAGSGTTDQVELTIT